ncbi:MAG: EamA family transporter RarD [Trueperaceae bacterium]|nr:EamA family transporter RarD [Trueperaceae bacterium]
MNQDKSQATGILNALFAYIIWGLLPIYWKLIHSVNELEILSHRAIWSCLFLFAIIAFRREFRQFVLALRQPKAIATMGITTILIALNWLIYIWSVNNGFVIETSLGYFINPLISVLMGVVFLKERLRAAQWLAIVVAAAGVLYLTFSYGKPPVLALTLAFTWALYGFTKKFAPLGSLYGLAIETALLLVPALLFLGYLEARGSASFLHGGVPLDLLLMGTGLATTIPLLLFASAVQRIPLSLIGIMQYIAPTLQFMLGRFVYKEAFSLAQFFGFTLVWLALAIFLTENLMRRKKLSSLKTAS